VAVRRVFSVVLAAVLVVGVIVAIVVGRERGSGQSLETVRGVVGSEKAPFFADPDVVAAFAAHGLRVTVDPAGSRQISEIDLAGYDFAFPSSFPLAERVQRKQGVTTAYAPFYSPMAIASFAPVMQLLSRASIAERMPDGHWVVDVEAYLAAARKNLRWDQIPGNTAYPARRNVLVTTTHPRDSNSAAMYASVVSYVANGNAIVRDIGGVPKVLDEVSALFLGQGYLENSTEGPFESYLANGLSYSPLVWVYEAQFLGRQFRRDGSIRDGMVLAYPSPTVLSKHTLVPLGDDGDRVGRLLTQDPELLRLAARHGFRTADANALANFAAGAGVDPPPPLVDVVDPPSYQVLETMLDAISRQYQQ